VGRILPQAPITTAPLILGVLIGALGSDFKREKPQHMVKLDVVSRYMFTFAMENDDPQDWVTEKVLDSPIA
jgi:hypothetical protein